LQPLPNSQASLLGLPHRANSGDNALPAVASPANVNTQPGNSRLAAFKSFAEAPEIHQVPLTLVRGLSVGPQVDCVLAMAQHIDTAALLVFIRSFRAHNKDARIVLFQPVGDASLPAPFAHRYAVDIERLGASHPLPPYMAGFHPSSTRWHIMLQYLTAHLQRTRNVLLVDVRDTYFQLDPFAAIPLLQGRQGPHRNAPANPSTAKPTSQTAHTDVFLSWYEQTGTIGGCSWNSGWVRDCFGRKQLSKLASKRIICSGVSLGTAPAALHYLQLMNSTVHAHRSCERNGVDQGMHQVVMRQADQWPQHMRVHLAGVEMGQVAHMQSMPQRTLGADGLLRATGNKDVYAIVHQYDRAAAVAEVYMGEFGNTELPQ
jgi:hypothetical protein